MSAKNRRVALILIFFLLLSIAGLAFLRLKGLPAGLLFNQSNRTIAQEISRYLSLADKSTSIIPGLPLAKPPSYKAENFKYISVSEGRKIWKILSTKALMYNPERLVHARQVTADLYDHEGKTTIIIGDEAKYFFNQSDLEIFGNVHILLPDGFEIQSPYVFYSAHQQHIKIPLEHEVQGGGKQDAQHSILEFKSHGMNYSMQSGLISLLDRSEVTFLKKSSSGSEDQKNEKTLIESDQSIIDKKAQNIEFRMRENRSWKDRFVHITQSSLLTRARKVRLNYGETKQLVNYLVAHEDILIKERAPRDQDQLLRYATAGRAEFNAHSDKVILFQFPQLYENGDTAVGDSIILHRNSDVVEIINSNAFSEGNRPKK
jgi:LPS export ABC transporter protein LptC